jgi:hypothetical protein
MLRWQFGDSGTPVTKITLACSQGKWGIMILQSH